MTLLASKQTKQTPGNMCIDQVEWQRQEQFTSRYAVQIYKREPTKKSIQNRESHLSYA